jgi:hypothetical protein
LSRLIETGGFCMRRRYAIRLSRSAQDVLVLLMIGTISVIGLLCLPDYAVDVAAVSIATILCFVIMR